MTAAIERTTQAEDRIAGVEGHCDPRFARVRDLLMQGLNDQYSEMYGPMTEAYYRRIAEEEDNR